MFKSTCFCNFCPQVQDAASTLHWFKCALCACGQCMSVVWDSERLTESTARVNSVMVRLVGTCKQRSFATTLSKNIFCGRFCSARCQLCFSSFCRSSIGIQQCSVPLSPLSAGQFFWSVVWFDSALMFRCVVRFNRIVFKNCLFLFLQHPLSKVLF